MDEAELAADDIWCDFNAAVTVADGTPLFVMKDLHEACVDSVTRRSKAST